jgi:hypothetical protein
LNEIYIGRTLALGEPETGKGTASSQSLAKGMMLEIERVVKDNRVATPLAHPI